MTTKFAWRDTLALYAPVTSDDLPGATGYLASHIATVGLMFPNDWCVALAVCAYSALWGGVRTENMPVALWFLGVNGAGVGKNITSDEAVDTVMQAARAANLLLTRLTGGSPEGLVRALEGTDRAVLAYYAEYGGALRSLRSATSGKETLCNLYDGRGVGHHLADENIQVERPHVTLVGTTTMTGITEAVNRADLANGYLSRFLWCAPDALDLLPASFPTPNVRLEVALTLAELRTARRDVVACDPDHAARLALDAYARTLGLGTGKVRDLDAERTQDILPRGRQVARTKRVAALLALGDGAATVEGDRCYYGRDHVALAVRLVGRGAAYDERVRSWILRTADQDIAERILGLYPEGGEALTVRDMQQATRYPVRDVQPAVMLLLTDGRLQRYREGRRELYTLTKAGVDHVAGVRGKGVRR